jgi:hypothetical protein
MLPSRATKQIKATIPILGLTLLAMAIGTPASPAEEATPEVRMRGDYPANLIYGAGNIPALGCPEEKQPQCMIEWAQYLNGFGLSCTRKTISWLHSEFERGEYNWTKLDNTLPHLVANGITPIGLVADTPVWASHPDLRRILDERNDGRFVVCLPNEDKYWPDFEAWLQTAVERYGHLVDYYEIWNEPDGMCGMYPKYWEGRIGGIGVGGDVDWYSELLKRSSKVIRAHDPVAKVSVGGFECKGGLETYFIEGIYERGCKPFFDAVAIHPYGTPFGQPLHRKWMAAVRGVMEKHGDGHKPFWITEYNNEGHDELDMSFTVRRKHRLIRETPWIAIAIPLGTQYMFYGKEAANWPLRAIRWMEQSEFGARNEWRQNFEASPLELFANWEWRAQSVGDKDWPKIRVKDYEGRNNSKGLLVEGQPSNKRIRVCFLPYVRSDDPTIELWYSVIPAKENAAVNLRVGVECLDILQEVRESDFITTLTDEFDQYRKLTFRIADHWPEWKDLGINMCWVEFSSADPGFSIAVDDVFVH